MGMTARPMPYMVSSKLRNKRGIAMGDIRILVESVHAVSYILQIVKLLPPMIRESRSNVSDRSTDQILSTTATHTHV
jgi:hypothetical protein